MDQDIFFKIVKDVTLGYFEIEVMHRATDITATAVKAYNASNEKKYLL
jgi:hypothetical protein